MVDNNNRGNWATSIGFILAAAGSAVGLGNIWKFPRMAANYGGGTFILVYLLLVIAIGIPVMMSEFAIGRKGQSNAVLSMRKANPKWGFVGYIGIITGFVVLTYYAQVAGWVLKYSGQYLFNATKVLADPTTYLVDGVLGASAFPWQGAVIFPALVLAITAFIVIKGISGGIEKANKVLMPALFIMLMVLFIRGLFSPGLAPAFRELTAIDFSSLNGTMFIVALGQAFFSLSLGMGIMITYASYLPKTEDLAKSTYLICGFDTLIALIAGFTVVPLALSVNINMADFSVPAASAGFGFIAMADAFKGMGSLGWLFGFLFYFLMFFAAITSAISLLEGTVAFAMDKWNASRKKVSIIAVCIMFFVGMPYTLSQAFANLKLPWPDFTGLNWVIVGDWMEYFTDRLMMPLCALMTCIFVGWVWGTKNAVEEIEASGQRFKLAGVYTICVKFVAPAGILAILLSGFGLF